MEGGCYHDECDDDLNVEHEPLGVALSCAHEGHFVLSSDGESQKDAEPRAYELDNVGHEEDWQVFLPVFNIEDEDSDLDGSCNGSSRELSHHEQGIEEPSQVQEGVPIVGHHDTEHEEDCPKQLIHYVIEVVSLLGELDNLRFHVA